MSSTETEEPTIEEVFTLSTAEIDELKKQAVQRAKETKHTWVQRGSYLVCTSCEFQHGIHIGTDKMYMGEKNGRMVFKSLTLGKDPRYN